MSTLARNELVGPGSTFTLSMNMATEIVTPPDVSPSDKSTAFEGSLAVIFNKHGLEGQPPPVPGDRRGRKPKYSLLMRGIAAGLSVLLLLAVVGAGSYRYYVGSVRPVSIRDRSSARKSSSVTVGDRSLSTATASNLSKSSMETPSPFSRAQSVLSKHPRPLVATVLALILAIALITTVAVLARALNAPPQVVERTIDSHSGATDSVKGYFGVSQPVLGAIVGCIAGVALLVIAVLSFKLWKASKASQPYQYTSPELLVANTINDMRSKLPKLFDDIVHRINPDDAGWAEHGIHQTNGAINFTCLFARRDGSQQRRHYYMNPGRRSTVQHFCSMIAHRSSLPKELRNRGFILTAFHYNSNDSIDGLQELPEDTCFYAETIDPCNTRDDEFVEVAFDTLMVIGRMLASNHGQLIPQTE